MQVTTEVQVATQGIETSIREMDETLLLKDDLPVRPTRLIVHFWADAAQQVPITNGKARLIELNREDDTDLMGTAELQRFRGGMYWLECSAPGRQTVIQVITIRSGKTLELHVYLPEA